MSREDRIRSLMRAIEMVRRWRSNGEATPGEAADTLRYFARHRGRDFVEAMGRLGPVSP